MFKKELKLLLLLVAMHCTSVNSMQPKEQNGNYIIASSNVTINNSNSQNITYTNSYNNNSIMPQDTIKQIRVILMNIMQQQYLNSNMRRDKLSDSFDSTEEDK